MHTYVYSSESVIYQEHICAVCISLVQIFKLIEMHKYVEVELCTITDKEAAISGDTTSIALM